jgi:hypothetical protein
MGCVWILPGTLPGGPGGYGEGATLTHELGHVFGLPHTFTPWPSSAMCTGDGDGIADTPPESEPAWACTIRDSCPGDGLNDPIHNFLDYTPDACMYEFTEGQKARMQVKSWLVPSLPAVIMLASDTWNLSCGLARLRCSNPP